MGYFFSKFCRQQNLSGVFFLKTLVEYLFTFLQAFDEWGDWPEDDDWSADLETPVTICKKYLSFFVIIFFCSVQRRYIFVQKIFIFLCDNLFYWCIFAKNIHLSLWISFSVQVTGIESVLASLIGTDVSIETLEQWWTKLYTFIMDIQFGHTHD